MPQLAPVQAALEAAASIVRPESELRPLAISCMDLTTLRSTDTHASVDALAHRAVAHQTAALCIFPVFLPMAREILFGTGVRLATVAMAFPHGQSPLSARLAEVEASLSLGADEIDVVIRRTLVLEERWALLEEELRLARKACGNAILKVIVESGELPSVEAIYRSARIALDAGAEFVKTSTGFATVGATPEAVATLALAVRDHGGKAGVKVSGGVRSLEDAQHYIAIVEQILGASAIAPQRFRIGASSLLDALLEA